MKRFDYVIFSSLSKLKEHESKEKNILFFYPQSISKRQMEKIYEALTMCTYLFADTLNFAPKIVHLGGDRYPLNFHCQIIHNAFLFAYGRIAPYDYDLILRGSTLYNRLTFEFGCLACAENYTKVNQRIATFLSECEKVVAPVFQCAIPRFMKMEPIVGQKAFNLLRVCLRQHSVIGGCIFYRHQLIADRLPNEVTHVLAILESIRKNVGSGDILPENSVISRLQDVALRQGVSLSKCYVKVNSIPPVAGVTRCKSRKASLSSVELCKCDADDFVKKQLSVIPRLCCLASRKVSDLTAIHPNSIRAKEKNADDDEQLNGASECSVLHDNLETLIAYVEAHSDICLCLIIRDDIRHVNQQLFDALYKLCFVLLRDLELCILRGQHKSLERDSSSRCRKTPEATISYHSYTNSYRRGDPEQKLKPHGALLQRVCQTLRHDDDLERVELSDNVIISRYGWNETATLYHDKYHHD